MRKLFFILILTISSISIQTPASASTFFNDVSSSHYAFDAIKWAKQVELIGGYPDGSFKPNQNVSEQQFARMLATYFDLEETEDELLKNTPIEKESDIIYNNLATYSVPLNGYFDNTLRGRDVTRGVVAQALGYLVDGQTTLEGSISFLVDSYISTGQNDKYEDRDIVKYFGAENTLTRAQAVTLFYRLSGKNYFYISNTAQEVAENVDEKSLMTRATVARSIVHEDFAEGSDYKNPKEKDKNLLAWNGLYSFAQRYGYESFDVRGLELTISNTDKETMQIELQTYDGLSSSFVEGTATLLTEDKAMLYETTDNNRCLIEFQKLDDAIRIVELDCAYERDSELTYTGVVEKD